jgi:hypothetical protein
MIDRFVQRETRAGEVIQVNGARLLPFSHVFRLRLPGMHGGLTWNRPAGVLIVGDDGQEVMLPVRDETRRLQFGFLGAALITVLIISIFVQFKDRKRSVSDER